MVLVKKSDSYVWKLLVLTVSAQVLHVHFIPRDGRPLTEDKIAGMLIGLLLAGQHTSSTTSAWMGFFLARDKPLQEKCYLEQKAVCGEHLPPLTYEQVCFPGTV